MRIILDVDGVLADFNNAYADLLESLGTPIIDRTPPWPKIWHWPEEVADPETISTSWKMIKENPEFFITFSPTDHALLLAQTGELQQLLEKHDVYVVTSRPAEGRGATEFWLSELFGVMVGSVHVKGLKGPIGAALGADLIIDDNVEHCESAEELGIQAMLIGQPYNNSSLTLLEAVRGLL